MWLETTIVGLLFCFGSILATLQDRCHIDIILAGGEGTPVRPMSEQLHLRRHLLPLDGSTIVGRIARLKGAEIDAALFAARLSGHRVFLLKLALLFRKESKHPHKSEVSPMSIDFHEILIDFRAFNTRGRNEETRFFGEHTFNRRIRKASAAINGFELYFGNSDHEIRNILVGCDAIIDDPNVGTVSARIKLKFADDGYDDPVDGWVNVLMFVDTVD